MSGGESADVQGGGGDGAPAGVVRGDRVGGGVRGDVDAEVADAAGGGCHRRFFGGGRFVRAVKWGCLSIRVCGFGKKRYLCPAIYNRVGWPSG